MLFKALHITVIFFGFVVVEHDLHSSFNVSKYLLTILKCNCKPDLSLRL
jgi:hypothetical protein